MNILWFVLCVCIDLKNPCLHLPALEQAGRAPLSVSQSSSSCFCLGWTSEIIKPLSRRGCAGCIFARTQCQETNSALHLGIGAANIVPPTRQGFGPVNEPSPKQSPVSPWELIGPGMIYNMQSLWSNLFTADRRFNAKDMARP